MKLLAIITLVRNEDFFLSRWVEYYGRVPGAALHVLDHETDDGSTDNLPANVTKTVVRHPEMEPALWMLRTVQDHMRTLFAAGFDRVIYAEADEFLVPDPERWPDLATFLTCHPDDDLIFSQGWNVVHRRDDLPLPESGPMLKGRHWKREPFYDMGLICKFVPNWKVGRHGIEDRINGPDVGLRTVHLHYADPDLGWKRIMDRRNNKPIARDGMGRQNKFENKEEFQYHWWEACDGGEPIPEAYQSIL